MIKCLILSGFFAFSSLSHAAFETIPNSQRKDAIIKVQTSIMKKFENGRPENCMMPYDHGFGVLFRGKDGGLRSREFIFTSNEGILDLPAYYDATLNAIMLQQSGSFGQTNYSLIVTFAADGSAKDIELKFNYSSENISVKCDQDLDF